MINALGPETPATLGSFWPESVARVIAAEQSSQTPAGLTPPGPLSARATRDRSTSGATAGRGAGRMSGSTGTASPAARGAHPDGPGDAGPRPGREPHRPRAHAVRRLLRGRGAGQVHTDPGRARLFDSAAVVAPAAVRRIAAVRHAAAGRRSRPSASRPRGRAAYGQAVFGQPGLGTPAPYPGQAPSYPGQAPRTRGSSRAAPDALPGYAPGRRKPMSAEVPRNVHTAIRLMYIGFVVTVLDVVLSVVTLGRYTHARQRGEGSRG